MAHYIEDQITTEVIGERRPTINEYFLSSYTMAVYDGCEIGCAYCDGWAFRIRPLNETVRAAVNLPQRFAEELDGIDPGDLIAISSQTDAYQPAEMTYRLTRSLLYEFKARQRPCLILTKSVSVLEDKSLLQQINEQSLAMVVFTLLTTDAYLAQKLEDKAAAPGLRLEAIGELKRAGIPTGVALVPVIPYVNDTDYALGVTLRAVADAGADFVVWDHLHIPTERHRQRIDELLPRLGSYPPSYYRDLYRGQALPDAGYRAERDREILVRCDALNLPIRPPHRIFTGKLRPANEAALLLKHEAARDAIQGRQHLAQASRQLADLVYQEQASDAQLRESPLYPTLRQILDGRTHATEG